MVVALIAMTIVSATSCTYYNRIIARKNLVDGSNAYKGRNFPEAERLFREAVALDPEGQTVEGRSAQLFLARTIHSQFIGKRSETGRAEEAIREYQKALALDEKDQSSYKAIASLYENLQKNDEWLAWVTARSTNANIPPEQRAEALVSLAAKKNTCANEVSDTEATKKTITKDGKQAFQFVKPASTEEFDKFRTCVSEGTALIDQALGLEPPVVKNATSFDIAGASDQELKSTQDLMKVFESARSYKTSLLIQSMRLAEMEDRKEDHERLKTESDAMRASFLALSDVVKKIQAEIDRRVAAAAAENAAPGTAPK
jgi:tetratricopeptide (TPR) repeat protein